VTTGMARRATIAATVVACAMLGGSGAGARDAASLTKRGADAVALRELRPQSVKGDVILFGLSRPLPAGSIVSPADPPPGAPGRVRTTRVAPLRAPAWLYWLDLDPYARFSHPSRFLLVDDATGKVVRRGSTEWYPAVDGRRPAFLATPAAYEAKAYRVFSRVQALPRAPSARDGSERSTAVPPGSFSNDCVLMVSDFGDPLFERDWEALGGWARSVGIATYFASKAGPKPSVPTDTSPTGADVNRNVDALVASGKCKDILLYLNGHGVRAERGPPMVVTGIQLETTKAGDIREYGIGVTANDLEAIFEEHPETTFKLKVDSCFSGRFLDQLLPGGAPSPANGNLLIVEVSSQATKVSYSVPAFLKGKENRDLNWKMGELTRQNVYGLRQWSASANEVAGATAVGGSLLARALHRGFQLGLPATTWSLKKGITPLVRTNYPPPAEPTSARVALTGSGTSYTATLTNTGTKPILCWQLTLPAGVQATGLQAPPAGWTVGGATPPPAQTIGGQNRTAGIPPGGSASFTFTTNGAVPKGSVARVTSTCTAASDVTVAVTGP
jgi:hypothetical protein